MDERGFHDDTFIALRVEHVTGDVRVVIEAIDRDTRRRYRVRCESCDRVATDCIGLIANECQVIGIAELPGSDLPKRYAMNRGCPLHEIRLSDGSSCRMLSARRVIEAIG